MYVIRGVVLAFSLRGRNNSLDNRIGSLILKGRNNYWHGLSRISLVVLAFSLKGRNNAFISLHF